MNLRNDPVAVGLATLAIASTVAAATPRSVGAQDEPLLTQVVLYEENDALAIERGSTDRFYTQGIQLLWTFGAPLGRLQPRSRGCRANQPNHRWCSTWSLGLGQTMYTPRDILDPAFQPGDRPYAGWTWGRIGYEWLGRRSHAGGMERTGLMPAVSAFIQAGPLGPAAGARSTQSLAHWAWTWASPRPQGWDHQISNRLGTNISAEALYKGELCWAACTYAHSKRYLDLAAKVGGTAGNVMVAGSVGGIGRLGFNIPDDFGVGRIPVTRGFGSERDRITLYGFVDVKTRRVVHNVFVTGAEGTLVVLEPGVTELAWGFAFGKGGFSFSWQRIVRSGEFAGSPDQRFGAVTLGYAGEI